MPAFSIGSRHFGLSVRYPERFSRAVRRPIAREETGKGELVVTEPPEVHADTHRHEQDALAAWVGGLDEETAAHGPAPDRVAEELNWYHTIELPDGTTTPGQWDHRPLVKYLGFPDDLTGRRVLDVGSANGFWAFELERRGGEVFSLDLEQFADIDFPPALAEIFGPRRVLMPFRIGLKWAREQLGSEVELVDDSVYSLDPAKHGKFDFVHAGDILLHLRDPALALQRLCSVTRGEALIVDNYDPDLDALGAGPGLTRFYGGWTDATWWVPALSTLVQMVADAGFRDVEVVTTYRLADTQVAEAGTWRAAIRARGSAE